MNYGLPYCGSKSRLCRWLFEYLPKDKSKSFYDVFAGGCAVTDYALMQGFYKEYHVNDLDPLPVNLYKDCIEGGFNLQDQEWVSSEDFYRLVDSDPVVRYCWSFGNMGKSYLYNTKGGIRSTENYKKAVWKIIYNDDWNLLLEIEPDGAKSLKESAYLPELPDIHGRRLALQKVMAQYVKDFPLNKVTQATNLIQSLERLERLQALERLERLSSLRKDGINLNVTTCSYNDLVIKPASIIYCDPPYHCTESATYKIQKESFNYEDFYDWCLYQKDDNGCDVYVSEYVLNHPRFHCIAETNHRNKFNGSTGFKDVEKLFRCI